MIDSNTKLIALIGKPSRHSLSPLIQNCFIRENNKNAAYVVFEVEPYKLTDSLRGMSALGFIGLNVTMPYKEKIFEMVDIADETSSATRSVNTVKFLSGQVAQGLNTDVEGLTFASENRGFCFEGSRALVIGAGGSARSCVYGLIKKGAEKVFVYNRTMERAENIKKLFKNNDRIRIIKELNDLNIKDINFIANCTPIGMALNDKSKKMIPVPENWNLKGKHILEMVYNPIETMFIHKAAKEGAAIINGIDMLIGQAAFSFKVWFDMECLPDTNNARMIVKRFIESGVVNET